MAAHRVWTLMRRVAVATAVLATGCGSPEPAAEQPGPPERFDWVRQPIEFAPPAGTWERQQRNEAGQLGVFFTHRGSVGERIIVAAFRTIAERDRREALRRLRDGLGGMSASTFRRELSLARARMDDPVSDAEADLASRVNLALDRAAVEYFAGRTSDARFAVDGALAAAESFQLDLEQVLERIRFHPEQRREPQRYGVVTERRGEVAGLPAVVLEYEFQGDEHPLACREVYVVAGGVAFTASYLGLERNLPCFDAVVASIRFPDPAQVAP